VKPKSNESKAPQGLKEMVKANPSSKSGRGRGRARGSKK